MIYVKKLSKGFPCAACFICECSDNLRLYKFVIGSCNSHQSQTTLCVDCLSRISKIINASLPVEDTHHGYNNTDFNISVERMYKNSTYGIPIGDLHLCPKCKLTIIPQYQKVCHECIDKTISVESIVMMEEL